MGIRFKRSVKLFPGLKLNIGKTGLGLSAGVKGAHVGFNKRGTYTNVGIPGTGVSNLQYTSTNKKPTQNISYSQPKSKSNFSILKIALIIVFFPFVIIYLIIKGLTKSQNPSVL